MKHNAKKTSLTSCLRIMLLCVTVGLWSLGVYAAPIKVQGTVTDQDGEPMIGVSVVVEGTSTGTSTDLDGKFTLNT